MFIGIAVAWTAGCSPDMPAEEASDELSWFALETGKRCVDAQIACGLGNCAANVNNGCGSPVTCKLSIECLCRAQTGEEGPATAESQDTTILHGDKAGIRAQVICDYGEVLATLARDVHCF